MHSRAPILCTTALLLWISGCESSSKGGYGTFVPASGVPDAASIPAGDVLSDATTSPTADTAPDVASCPGAPCTTAGATTCEENTPMVCGDPDDDGCLDWIASGPCGDDAVCTPTGCAYGCVPTCESAGATQCQGDGVVTCGDGGAGCFEWSAVVACPAGETCSNGACSSECADECDAKGDKSCGTIGKRTCGSYDEDPCLEWGDEVPCAAGTTCSAGQCSKDCVDACPAAGAVDCQGGGAVTCADLDGDGCVEWSAPKACGDGEVCQGGACVAEGCGEAACVLWTETCSGTTGTKMCGLDDETGCPALSPFISCQEGSSCAGGQCKGACVMPEVMLVVDRSSSMEGDKWTWTQKALIKHFTTFDAKLKLGVRMFPGAGGCEPGAVVPIAKQNAAALSGALVAPSTASATPLAASLGGLEDSFGDPNQGEYVVLLTDGTETCGDESDLIAAVDALRSRGTRTFVVGIGSGYDEVLLGEAAAHGGTGQLRVAKSQAALEDVLLGITDEMETCCIDGDKDGYGLICDKGADCDDGNGKVHAPQCSGKECGEDGCGGSCGTCGASGKPHASLTCGAGKCNLVCDGGYHLCGGSCASNSSPETCGTACAPCTAPQNGKATCNGASCGFECNGGYHKCGGQCLSSSSPESCGSSCSPCNPPANATATCSGGTCGFACKAGYHKCGGACVSDTSPSTCGDACSPCAAPAANGQATCSGGTCGISCNAGHHLCGSECLPNDDVGSCGTSCSPCKGDPHGTAVCEGGTCAIDCKYYWHDCGGVCVANDLVESCGTECTPCTAPAHGTATCNGYSCDFDCDKGYSKCGDQCVKTSDIIEVGEGKGSLSMVLDPAGVPQVATFAGDLSPVIYTGSGGTWSVESVASPVSGPQSIELVRDANGARHVAYAWGSSGSSSKQYVTYRRETDGSFVAKTALSQTMSSVTALQADLAVDSAKNAHFVWKYRNYGTFGDKSNVWYRRYDAATDAFDDAEQLFKPWVDSENAVNMARIAVDSQGNPLIAYTYNAVRWGTRKDGVWTIETALPVPYDWQHFASLSLLLGSDGTPHLGVREGYNGSLRYLTTDAAGWADTKLGTGGLGQANDVALDASGAPILAASNNGASSVELWRLKGGKWQSLGVVQDLESVYDVDVEVDALGGIHVAYVTIDKLWYAKVTWPSTCQ